MFSNHPVFEQPPESNSLWRYLDFTKFLLLLETSSLYFCRASLLCKEDPFEGSFPKLEYDYLVNNFKKDVPRNIYDLTLNQTFVSCWHYSEKESVAMWKLYSEVNKGVAIKTTVNDFKNSFNKTNIEIFAGIVQYINYDTEPFYANSDYKYSYGNTLTNFIHKRDIFEYEKEYRAILRDQNLNNKNGINVPIDISLLVKQIIVAPNTPSWMFELIKSTASKYLMQVSVIRSIFESKPYF